MSAGINDVFLGVLIHLHIILANAAIPCGRCSEGDAKRQKMCKSIADMGRCDVGLKIQRQKHYGDFCPVSCGQCKPCATSVTVRVSNPGCQAHLDALQHGSWIRHSSASPGWPTRAYGTREVLPTDLNLKHSSLSKSSVNVRSKKTSLITLPATAVPLCKATSKATDPSLHRCLFTTGSTKGQLEWLPSAPAGAANWRHRSAAEAAELILASTSQSTSEAGGRAMRSERSPWVHILGDSTMRFLYAAWLSLLNGTSIRAAGYPLHWLPDSDQCSFVRAGWTNDHRAKCFKRWRGRCWGAKPSILGYLNKTFLTPAGVHASGCVLDFDVRARGRLSFEWLTHSERRGLVTSGRSRAPAILSAGASLAQGGMAREGGDVGATSSAATLPDVVIFGAGVHEAVGGDGGRFAAKPADYERRTNETLAFARRIREQLPPSSWLIIAGNGACKLQQVNHYGQRISAYPTSTYERMLEQVGNPILRRAAIDMQQGQQPSRTLFLDRSKSMTSLEKVSDSPCWQHHAYGLISEVHVQLILNAISAWDSSKGTCQG